MSKVMGICVKFCSFLRCSLQIWLCRLTHETNFENFSFCANFTFNIRKSHKISSGIALYLRSYQPKTSRGGGGGRLENIPPLGLIIAGDKATFSSTAVKIATQSVPTSHFVTSWGILPHFNAL